MLMESSYQDKVLDFITSAYHDQSGTLTVPESLTIKKDLKGRQEVSSLKSYRPTNRYYSCSHRLHSKIFWATEPSFFTFFLKRLPIFTFFRHFINRHDCSEILDWIRTSLWSFVRLVLLEGESTKLLCKCAENIRGMKTMEKRGKFVSFWMIRN